ncbi:eukaryotic translation initiation factor 2-alpha kinase 3 [Caerostris extrusa]|uniref:Eukaryotic translation initiation factor 2-alpha kinase 3 n=1 Tax=Caerostris extrusa TaxID=172846 RepID=A0AAV4WBJ8_CAEEX|nr:eukaryotic translation initiation factor 2-alpha kinase 3 [Caerostris extrusa]
MSPEKFLSMFGNSFKFAVDAMYIQEYENAHLLMFHNTPLHEYRMDLVDDDPEFAGPRYLYIQMELCHKDNLRIWLKKHCEQRNYSQPSNIYFSLNGLIKIGDFGFATQFEIPGVDHSYEYDLFSSHSVKVGTLTYMSPEQTTPDNLFRTQGKFSEDFIEKYENESLLIKKMLDPNSRRRPTALEILQHPLCLPYR